MKSIFFRSIFPVKKLPGRKGVKYAHPSGIKDLISKSGQSTRDVTYRRLLQKHPTSSRSAIRAFKIAKIKGEKKIAALTKKFGAESHPVLKTQFKSKGEWTFKEPFHDVKGTRKLRRFKAYIIPKAPKNLSQTKMQKTFLRDDDPTKALKSMRLDKEGSHMRGLPTEPRHVKGVGDVIDWDYKKYKKSEFLKMSKGIGAKGQKPFTNYQKTKVMEAGKKGLEKHIDRELSAGTTMLVNKLHVIKRGKSYTKSYGKFRVPAKEFGHGVKYPVGQPVEYITKKKILHPITRKKIDEKITGSGTYKWRKGKKHKIFTIE